MSMKQKKVWNVIAAILWIIEFVAEAVAVVSIRRLNMVPTEYFTALTVLFLLVWLLCGVLLLWQTGGRKKGYGRRAIACILVVLVVAGSVGVTSVTSKLHETVNKVTQKVVSNSLLAVYVLSDDPAQTLQDASGYTFAVTDVYDAEGTQAMVAQIQTELGQNITTVSFDDVSNMVDALYEQRVGAVIMNEAYAAIIEDLDDYLDFAERVRILYEFTVVKTVEVPVDSEGSQEVEATESYRETRAIEDITNTPFVVYLSGSDTRSKMLATSRSDVNILAVVNPQTKQILLVNTPRDYYVPNPAGNGALDKLTHCGIYGIDCSMAALAGLYDVTVDYYAQINFTGFETLIDAIGGVSVYSDTSFKSSLYGYSYQKGYNDMNGSQALAFARERYAFASGDNARGLHQMEVIKAIVAKMSAGTIVSNYSSIMDSLQGMFITDMSADDISSLVKMQLSDMASWNVVSFAVTGSNGSKKTYSMPSVYAYVMIPNEKTVEYASELIDRVLNGETLTDADMTLPG